MEACGAKSGNLGMKASKAKKQRPPMLDEKGACFLGVHSCITRKQQFTLLHFAQISVASS